MIDCLREAGTVQVSTKSRVATTSNNDIISWIDILVKYAVQLLIGSIPDTREYLVCKTLLTASKM